MIPRQCALHQIEVPFYLKRWMNFRQVLTRIYDMMELVKDIPHMMHSCQLPCKGRQHNARVDVNNSCRAIQQIPLQKRLIFDFNSKNYKKDKNEVPKFSVNHEAFVLVDTFREVSNM